MMLLHKHSPTDLTEGCPACKAQTDRITNLEQQVARLTEERDGFESDWRRAAATGAELAGRLVEQEKSLAAKNEALREICTLARGNPGTYAIKVVRDIEELARAALDESGEETGWYERRWCPHRDRNFIYGAAKDPYKRCHLVLSEQGHDEGYRDCCTLPRGHDNNIHEP